MVSRRLLEHRFIMQYTLLSTFMRTKILPLILGLVMALPSGPVQTNTPELLSVANLAIPESLGKVQDRFTGTSARWVVQIQDVHGHVTAQENIAAILDHLQVVYGIKTVAVEGAWRSTTLPESWALPNSRAKQQLARKLLEDGYFSGPVYEALFAPSPLLLAGIEDASLYRENRKIYLDYLAEESTIAKKIKSFEETLESEKTSTLNPELLSFDKSLAKYRDGTGAETFLPFLISQAQSKAVELTDLDQIALFAKILQLSQLMNRDALQSEAAQMADHYKFERLSFEELLRSGKVPQEDLQSYPEVSKYREIMILQDKIDHQAFAQEIETLIQKVQAVLATTDAEKATIQKIERWMLAKKMITLKASPKDLARMESDRAGIESLATEAGLADALKNAGQFYDFAKKRDDVFFQKIISDASLSSDLAVVTGGFHTEGLSEQLRAAGISYIVITPDLAGQEPDEALYHKLLAFSSNESKAETQTLKPEDLVINTATADQVFVQAVKASFNGRVDTVNGERVFLAGFEGSTQTLTANSSVDSAATVTATNTANSKLSEAEIKTILQEVIAKAAAPVEKGAAAETKLVLAIDVTTLSELTANPTDEGTHFWNDLVKNPGVLVYAIRNEQSAMLPDALMDAMARHSGQKHAEVRLKTAAGFLELAAQPDFKRIYALSKDQVGAIVKNPDDIRSQTQALLLPAEPISFWIFRLALLDSRLRALVSTSEGFTTAKGILLTLEANQRAGQSA